MPATERAPPSREGSSKVTHIVILTPKVEDYLKGECCDHAYMGITEPKSWGLAPSSEVLSSNSAPHNLRFIVPNKFIDWHDLRLGDFHENPKLQCGDFPIRDRDNQWTYQFAVCVDDIDEGITHIVRGEDIRNSTARQIALMEALGRKERPVYLHHPLIVDANNKKLSKRELAHSLRQDKEAGISPETLFGRVCYKAHLTENDAPRSLIDTISIIMEHL